MAHSNRSTSKATAAVFIDTDGLFVLALRPEWGDAATEYDLGSQRPGSYLWATKIGRVNARSWQVCENGAKSGNTLSWPAGKVLSYRAAADRAGNPMQVPEYSGLSDTDCLDALGRMCNARTYRSRATYEQHFLALSN